MEYELKMIYDREDVAAFVRVLEFRRRPEKNLRVALKIGYPIFGILLSVMGIAVPVTMLSTGVFSFFTLLFSLVCLVIGIILLRRSNAKAMERRSWEKYEHKGLLMHYRFFSDHFEESDEATGEHSFDYVSLKNANEDPDHFFLFTETNSAHILKKKDFSLGDPNTFAEFLLKKAMVRVDPIDE